MHDKHDSRRRGLHTYRLVLGDDGKGVARIIEFEAAGAEAALMAAQRMCGGREAEVFQDGRSLGLVKNDPDAGFWILKNKRETARAKQAQEQVAQSLAIPAAQPAGQPVAGRRRAPGWRAAEPTAAEPAAEAFPPAVA